MAENYEIIKGFQTEQGIGLYDFDSLHGKPLNATQQKAGLLSPQDKKKIDEIDYPVDSVNGKTGSVQITYEDVGAASAEVESQKANGSVILLQNSGEAPIQSLKLYGKTIQNGTPTPENPVSLESVGDDGSVGVTVLGKNLLEYTEVGLLTDYKTGTVAQNANVVSAIVYVKNTDKIYVSGDFSLVANGLLRMGLFHEYPEVGSVGTYKASGTNPTEIDVTGYSYVLISFSRYLTNAAPEAIKSSFMCSLEANVPYEAPKEPQTLTASTVHEDGSSDGLRGIPVTSGGNYTDENGQQWICDEIDFEHGVYVQRIGTIDAKSLSWKFSVRNFFFVTLKLGGNNVLCNSYPCVGACGDDEVPSADKIITLYKNLGGIRIKDTQYADSASLVASLDGVKITYPLVTPIKIPIPEAELTAYRELHTHYPNTTVYNDGGAYMEMKYATPNTVVSISGTRMAGSIDMNNHNLTGIPDPENETDAANKKYVGQVVERVDQKVETLRGIVSKFHSNIVEEANGDIITLNGSSDMELAGLKLFGKTTQRTTTGKNLAQLTDYSNTINGVAITVNAIDGTITLNGTATDNDVRRDFVFSSILPAGRYILSLNNTSAASLANGAVARLIVAHNESTHYLNAPLNIVDSRTASFDTSDTVDRLILYAEPGAAFNNVVLKPQLEAGSTATAFEPYTGGAPSPSPDYPQPLESVGESKNLLNVPESFTFTRFIEYKNLYIPKGKYIVSCGVTTTQGDAQPSVGLYSSDDSRLMIVHLRPNTTQEIEVNQDIVRIVVYSNGFDSTESTGKEATVNQFMISESGGKYMPYQKGNIDVTVAGKNLLGRDNTNIINNELIYGLTFSENDDGTFNVSGEPTEVFVKTIGEITLPAGTYVYSQYNSLQSGIAYQLWGVEKNVASFEIVTLANTDISKVFTLNKTTKVRSRFFANVGANLSNLVVKVQIETGDTATKWEPYVGSTITASAAHKDRGPNGLPGIPIEDGNPYTSGNYTDENGQRWVCDEIDFARGMYVKRIESKVLNGTETWTVRGNGYGTAKIGAYGTIVDRVQMSTHLKSIDVNEHVSKVGICVTNNVATYRAQVMIRHKTGVVTAEEVAAFLTENPVTLFYVLAEPIETPLSAEEMAKYSALHTHYPNTTIFNDAGAHMEIKYVADTKMYVDKKFEELAEILVNKL